MSLRRDWNEFWFAPIAAGSLGLFRLVYGVLLLAYGLLLFPQRAIWFSEDGVLTRAAANAYNYQATSGPRLELLNHVRSDQWITPLLVLLLLASLCLTVGLGTRWAAVIVFVSLSTLHNRDAIIHNSGDTVMMVMAAYLVLAPAGAACSLDRLRRILRGRESGKPPRIVPWVQRLMQLQVCAVYLSTSMSKIGGGAWQDGTAVYYPLHLPETARFPLPWINGSHPLFINLLTYGTLTTEIMLWSLIWVPRLRLYVLTAGVLLHLGIEYSMNIPLFSFLMIASYLLFIRESDWQRFFAWLREPLASARLRLVYDGECDFCRSVLLVVRFLDVFQLVTFLDYLDPEQLQQTPGVRFADAAQAAIAVDTRDRQYPGFFAFRALAWRLPATWLLAPFLYIPGVPSLGRRAYRWVADNRDRLPVAPIYRHAAPNPLPEKEHARA